LPEKISKLQKLEILELWGNKLEVGGIPQDIGDLSKLERLNLGRNNLTELPGGVVGLKSHLKYLNMINNERLDKFPENITELTKLTHLTISGSFNSLPDEIGELTELRVLNLGGNKNLDTVPSSLGKLKKLQVLDLGKNKDSVSVNKELTLSPIKWYRLRNLSILKLGYNKLDLLPDEIRELPKLVDLDLSYNNCLKHVPLLPQKTDPKPIPMNWWSKAINNLVDYWNKFIEVWDCVGEVYDSFGEVWDCIMAYWFGDELNRLLKSLCTKSPTDLKKLRLNLKGNGCVETTTIDSLRKECNEFIYDTKMKCECDKK